MRRRSKERALPKNIEAQDAERGPNLPFPTPSTLRPFTRFKRPEKFSTVGGWRVITKAPQGDSWGTYIPSAESGSYP